MFKPALDFKVLVHAPIALEIQGVVNAAIYFIQGKHMGLNGQARDFNRHFRSDAPAGGAGGQDVNESGAAFHLPGFFKLAHHILRVADTGGGGIGDAVGGQRFHDIFFTGFLPFVSRSGGGLHAVWGGRGTLDTGVHVGFIVIANEDAILVAFHGAAQGLEADVEGTAVSGPGKHRGLGVPAHVKGGPQPAGGRTGGGKGRVQDGDFQRALGIGPGDNAPAAGRDNHHGLFSQGLQGKLHGNGGAASGTTQMPRVHQIIVFYGL